MGGWKSKRCDNNTNKSDEDNDEDDDDDDDNITLLHFYLWNPWAD